jgi:hypothetical protein
MKGTFGVAKTVLHPAAPLKKYVESNDSSSSSDSVFVGPIDLHCQHILKTHQ